MTRVCRWVNKFLPAACWWTVLASATWAMWMLRDRKHLSQDGLIIVVMAIDRDQGVLVSGPDIISRGFIYVRENEDIIESTREVVRSILLSSGKLDGDEWPALKNRIKDELHRFIYEKIKRNPMILPIIVEI